ncbi:hypothetical protein PS410_02835 [Pediococcus acidilactici]
MIVATEKMTFNQRHSLAPIQRFTKEAIASDMLAAAQKVFHEED